MTTIHPEEFARRERAANEQIQRVLQPHFEWLAKTDLMFGKLKVIQNPILGTVSIEKTFEPEMQKAIYAMQDLVKQTKTVILRTYFPEVAP